MAPAALGFGNKTLTQRPTYLYRHYGVDDALLYVGIAYDVPTRLRGHHHRASPWFPLVTQVLVQQFPTRLEAAEAETIAILLEGPLYNEHISRRIPKDAVRPLRPSSLRPIGQPRIWCWDHGAVKLISVADAADERFSEQDDGADQANLQANVQEIREFVREMIAPLAAELDRESKRADDAVAADRIAVREVATLCAELDRRRDWSLWRRLRWALLGEGRGAA
jgi:hypothetical protein